MCGRYRLHDPKTALDFFEAEPPFPIRPRYNIAPSQTVPIVSALRQFDEMTWGITPKWGRETSKHLINARSETVREKRSFRDAFASRRCLFPADGFYEWSREGKQPYLLTMKDGAPFAIAGFWEEEEKSRGCCLLTTTANSVLEPIHHRMPVIVHPADWRRWFAEGELSDETFRQITSPYPADKMTATAVSSAVNNAKIDAPRCCEAAAPDDRRGKLQIHRPRKGAAGQGQFEF